MTCYMFWYKNPVCKEGTLTTYYFRWTGVSFQWRQYGKTERKTILVQNWSGQIIKPWRNILNIHDCWTHPMVHRVKIMGTQLRNSILYKIGLEQHEHVYFNVDMFGFLYRANIVEFTVKVWYAWLLVCMLSNALALNGSSARAHPSYHTKW